MTEPKMTPDDVRELASGTDLLSNVLLAEIAAQLAELNEKLADGRVFNTQPTWALKVQP